METNQLIANRKYAAINKNEVSYFIITKQEKLRSTYAKMLIHASFVSLEASASHRKCLRSYHWVIMTEQNTGIETTSLVLPASYVYKELALTAASLANYDPSGTVFFLECRRSYRFKLCVFVIDAYIHCS